MSALFLPETLRARDVDHLEAVAVELRMKSLEARPIAIRALEDDAAAFEQPLQHELDLEPTLLVLLDAEREVLEIDEDGSDQLATNGRVGRHRITWG